MSLLTHRLDGAGPPVILLNGGLMSIASWDSITASLAGEFQLLRCDLRGQLLSPGPRLSMARHAAEVVELLDHLSIRRAHVVGTSFGGEVAMRLAADHPERVDRLVILTATDRLTREMVDATLRFELAARAAADGGDGGEVFRILAPTAFSRAFLEAQPDDFVETRARQIAALPLSFFDGLAGVMRTLRETDLSDAFPRIAAPTLVIGAALDETFPVEHSRAIAEKIAGSQLLILEGSGHAAVVEATGEVVRATRSFLLEGGGE
ncbi:MAG: alpha/beta hydrolase [Acidobacteria bacterium]|nr:alpha/beta hydrolase [Acidobacteriota bacterium]